MNSIDQLISSLEGNNSECEVSDNFRAIMALNFLQGSGNARGICTFAESKREIALEVVRGEIYWEYFIPHTAITSEFFSTVDRSLSIWNFAGDLLRSGVEIYGLDEPGNLFGISHKYGVRKISACARKSLPSNAK